MLDFNSHQWCVNLPRGSRQPAPHMGQVDAGETVSHKSILNKLLLDMIHYPLHRQKRII